VGGIVFLVGVWACFRDPSHADVPQQKLRMFLKRRYWLYYLLTFMSGARRQIYMVFSMFLMVKVFHFSVQTITVLFIVNNLINWIINPMIGRAINAFGERTLCTIEYTGVIMVFLTYAYASSKWVVAGMYILDYILFNFAVAIRTYFQKIADPEDIAPTSAVGFTINHIAAVFLPALGGYLWMLNYRLPFIMGAVMGVVSLGLAQFIRVPVRHGAAEVRP
jgi:predicted MFS family arabinose efflux permease